MGSYTVALTFEDGVTRFVSPRPDETIVDAAYRERINLPVDCRDGVCGTCKSVCETGTYDAGSYLEEALTSEEAAQGFCLPCQMRPTSDCTLRVPVASTACKVQVSALAATLLSVEQLSGSTISFSLSVDDQQGMNFLCGQYAHVGVPGSGVERAYSFSSVPGSGTLEFLVRHIPTGLMSRYLRDAAQPGDRVTVKGPFGSFYLRPVVRPTLMLAGGTGLAPFLSMLRRLAATGTDHSIHLVYGVTNDADLVALDVLGEIAKALPGFTHTTCVAAAGSGHARLGYVTEHLPAEMLASNNFDLYLCGPPPMVEAVRANLHERNATPANFYFEKFLPSRAA